MKAEEMIDRIDSMCKTFNLEVRYWQLGRGWSKDAYLLCFDEIGDMNIEGLAPVVPGSKWNKRYGNNWVISLTTLSNPEFQAEFEDEFHARLLYSTFNVQ